MKSYTSHKRSKKDMPFIPSPERDTSQQPSVSYPTDKIRQVAQQIIHDAQQGLDLHTQTWSQVLRYADTTPAASFGLRPVKMVLYPHEQRLQASYHWQIQMGKVLEQVADQIQQEEKRLVSMFQ
jgi:hypothetical protein